MATSKLACVIPTWDTLFAAPKQVFIASPWISNEGCEFLARLAESCPCESWEIWTRLDPLDYVLGYSDYPALLALNRTLQHRAFSLWTADNLHLKVFWDGNRRGLIGSSNLTGGGFTSNVELGVLLEGDLGGLRTLLAKQRERLNRVSIAQLENLVRALADTEGLRQSWASLKLDAESLLRRKTRRQPPYFGIR